MLHVYNHLGNISYKTERTTNPNTSAQIVRTINYEYGKDGKTGWNYLLTGYDTNGNGVDDSEKISYDNIGNPIVYRGAQMAWKGRQLTGYAKNGTMSTFTYDADGLRGSKTVDGVKTTYQYVGDKLYYEKRGDSQEFYYFYDSYGNLASIYYTFTNGTYTSNAIYRTLTNIQGDVVAIYTNSGALVARYEYDAWGNVLSVKDANGSPITQWYHIANANPIRYRGYYYDSDLGLYYLQSRYYDSEIGRFINADEQFYQIFNEELIDYSLYVYCRNNPVSYFDYNGFLPFFAFEVALSVEAEILKPMQPLPYPSLPKVSVGKFPSIPDGMLVDFAPVYGTPDMSVNMRKYPSRRDKSKSRKIAYEKAKKAGKGKEPIHHPHGHDGNKTPHYHPNVKNPYSKTPHQPNSHDHYYYSGIPSLCNDSMVTPSYPTSRDLVMSLLER